MRWHKLAELCMKKKAMVIGGFQERFNWISIQTCNMNEGTSVNTDLYPFSQKSVNTDLFFFFPREDSLYSIKFIGSEMLCQKSEKGWVKAVP